MGKYSDHSTYINNKNIEVPSVTTIIKLLNKPHIATWANTLGWKRQSYKKVLEDKANSGTLVHEICHEYLFNEGTKFDIPVNKLLYVKNNLSTFKNFLEMHNLNPIWGEKSFSSEKYGGTVDLYCELEGKKTIIDFKTSKKFYSSHFIQLGAYIQLLEEFDYKVEQVGILIIHEDDWDLKLLQREDMEIYINLFNKLSDIFYIVYELNDEWKDLM